MGDIAIEQLGGFVGAGGRIRTMGRHAWAALSEPDRARLDALFAARKSFVGNLRYRLTRQGADGPETIEVAPEDVPETLVKVLQTVLE